MEENLSLLDKDRKQVIAKSLLDLNYSATEISRLLEIDRSTVYRYSKEPTPEELLQFATEFKTALMVKQHLILAKVLRKIEVMVDKTLDFNAVLKAYEIMRTHTQSLYDVHLSVKHVKKYGLRGHI